MVLKRKITEVINKWYKKPVDLALVIKGARQIGKSTTIINYLQSNNIDYVELNFWKSESYKEVFDDSLIPQDIIHKIEMLTHRKINDNTVIFLDEIQDCPRAKLSLKFFAEQKKYKIICSGSLLGLNLSTNKKDKTTPVPVGSQEFASMYAMDFEEFLWNTNVSKEDIIKLQTSLASKTRISSFEKKFFSEKLKQYLLVGGMPKAFIKFVETNSYDEVHEVQKNILLEYKDDITKYAETKVKIKAIDCFNSIPSQLGKVNTKFFFNLIKQDARYDEYCTSIEWLKIAGMMIQTKNLLCVEPPLTGHCSEKEFKIYFNDIGLLSAMLSTSDRLALLTDSIFNYKGYIIENLVADMLFKLGNELYYFEKDGYEIDFVVQGKDKINVLEVKASNKRSKSLDYFINKYNYDYNYYKIIDGNIGTQKYTSIPLFLAFLIR